LQLACTVGSRRGDQLAASVYLAGLYGLVLIIALGGVHRVGIGASARASGFGR
jgi:hypothetical protein